MTSHESHTNVRSEDFIDPVCGMTVSAQTTHRHAEQGVKYGFCSESCLTKFRAEPERYLNPKESETHPAASDEVDYTCPMHPEIVQDHPGNCPKCGMALQPRTITVEEKNEELIDMSRRFWVSAVLAAPVFVLAMSADLAPDLLPEGLSIRTVQWVEFVLATPVVLWGGWPFFVRGWQSVVTGNLNMFTLIGLGVGVAWTYSVVALLLPDIFPAIMRHQDGTVPVYFEAAAVITALVLLGQVLELRARSQTNAAIKMLLGLAPNSWVSTGLKPKCYPIRRLKWSNSFRPKAASWPWRETASTMRLHWRNPKWASPWARAPTLPWRAPG